MSAQILESSLIEQPSLREKCMGKLEVLGKVKRLFFIPAMELMTTKMMADYFEVDLETIQKCYQRHKKELDKDGVCSRNGGFIRNYLLGQRIQVAFLNGVNVATVGKRQIKFSNSTTKLFSKRAILRIAMLLRDSKVAKEVRTQLLNTFEHATEEQRAEELIVESDILFQIGKAIVERNIEALAYSAMKHFNYLNRHVDKQSSYIKEQVEQIDKLTRENLMQIRHYEGLLSDKDKLSSLFKKVSDDNHKLSCDKDKLLEENDELKNNNYRLWEDYKKLFSEYEKLSEPNVSFNKDDRHFYPEGLNKAGRTLLASIVRLLSHKTKINSAEIYVRLYGELRREHEINVMWRGPTPYSQHIRDDEWERVFETFKIMCESWGVSYDKILEDVDECFKLYSSYQEEAAKGV